MKRIVLMALVLALVTSMASVGPRSKPAGAYAVTDLPALGGYCHPQMIGTTWPNQPPGCKGMFQISSTYDCCNDDGSLINYQGMNFSRTTIGLTKFGSLSSPPSFTVTASEAPDGPARGDMRISWKRLDFLVDIGATISHIYADPVTTCGVTATSCLYRFDPVSLGSTVGITGLGDPPKWVPATIEVPVNTGSGCCATYGWGQTLVGFYKTDNQAPVPGAIVASNEGSTVSYHFNASSSYDPDDEPVVRYHWVFGDGTEADGKVVDHVYPDEGPYDAKLFVLDDDGAQAELRIELGKLMTMKLEASALPKKDGDLFSITATMKNGATQPLHCMNIGSLEDIRPKTSFTKVSGPSSAFLDNTVARGGTVTATWTFKLKGAPPASMYFYASGFAGGAGGSCPPEGNAARASADRTWTLGGAQPFAPFASWTAFVQRQYQDVVGRAPTTSELSTWLTKLNNATRTGADVVHELRRSTDNVNNIDATARLYRALLGRAPDKGGLAFWINRRRSGAWTLVKMADYFASSAEFKRKYGTLTNRQFVTRIYTDVLGRPADPGGVDFWTNQLDTKRRTRGSVMVGFSESNEYKTKQAETVDGNLAYFLLLGRLPTAGELATWTTAQKGGTTHQILLQQILSSDAYKTRITG